MELDIIGIVGPGVKVNQERKLPESDWIEGSRSLRKERKEESEKEERESN